MKEGPLNETSEEDEVTQGGGDLTTPAITSSTKEQQTPQSATGKGTFPFGSLGRSNTTGGAMMPAAHLWPSSSATGSAGQPGMGTFGNFALPGRTEKPAFTRGESRFASIIGNKDSSENVRQEGAGSGSADVGRTWRPRPRTDTDPFGSDDNGGFGVGRGAQPEINPRFPQDSGALSFETPLKPSAADFGMAGLHLGQDDGMTLSPSETNPFRSPAGDTGLIEEEHQVLSQTNEGPSGLGTAHSFPAGGLEGSDRSQNSSVGPAKGIGGFPSGLGGGWPSGPSVGTPDRERQFSAFGSGVFGPVDIQSPSMGVGLGGIFGAPSTMSGTSSLRGGKLASLLPPAMGASGQSQDHVVESLGDSVSDLRNPMGSIGRSSTFNRNTESPMRAGLGGFEELFTNPDSGTKQAPIGTQASIAPAGTIPAHEAASVPTSAVDSAHQNPMRQMVMPDRMAWVYLDPQGNTQGPFSGLEMHDWYKGNYFSPDLRIKKVEDVEFEPLGHLIRRIGNSREPFLVPQVGIPHGPPPPNYGSAGPSGMVPPLPNAFPQFGRVLPADEQNNLERRKQEEQMKMARQRDYFAQQQAINKIPGMGSIGLQHHSSAHSLQSQPSFGSISSPAGMPTHPPIGAGITPATQQPPVGGNTLSTDFFGMPTGAPQPSVQPGIGGSSLNMFVDDTAGQLTRDQRQMLPAETIGTISAETANIAPGSQPTTTDLVPETSQLATMGQRDSGFLSQLPHTDQLEDDPMGFKARLREFQDYQSENMGERMTVGANKDITMSIKPEKEKDTEIIAPTVISTSQDSQEIKMKDKQSQHNQEQVNDEQDEDQTPTLTQQVQKTQAAKQAKQVAQDQQVWGKSHPVGFPMPFPPPQPGTPLPAPTAQRTRSTLPEQYANRSQSETPEMVAPQSATSQAPPLAPWARETVETHHKGPSLKEIQEAEEKKAARAEQAAAAARRAALEEEAAKEREKATTSNNPILPTSSTWAHTPPVSSANANTALNAWAKSNAAKGTPVTAKEGSSVGAKTKNFMDIQREEEARKKKESATTTGSIVTSGGKRYADFASKPGQAQGSNPNNTFTSSSTPTTGSGWTTVTASGKPKASSGPTVSGRTANPPPATTPKAVATRMGTKEAKEDSASALVTAREEFKKWISQSLKNGGASQVDVSSLMAMPDDAGLIAEIVYGNSSTMDGHRFADEFLRRKKAANKGIVEKATPILQNSKNTPGGGWNEVAKRGGHTKNDATSSSDMSQPTNFKVVSSRKKSRK